MTRRPAAARGLLRFVAVGSASGAYGGPFDTASRQSAILAGAGDRVSLAYAVLPGDGPRGPADRAYATLETRARRLWGRSTFTTVISLRAVRDVVRWVRAHDTVMISLAREPLPVVSLVASVAWRRRVVVQTHGNLTYDLRLKHHLFDLALKPLVRRAAAVVALTDHEAHAVTRWIGRHVPPIHTLGNPSAQDVDTTAAARSVPRTRDVVFAARMDQRKRPHVFAQAALHAHRHGWAERYVAYGSDQGAVRDLEHVGRALGRPIYRGALTARELDAVMQTAGVFVLVSEREPWGNVLLQAINYGIPVVVCSSSALAPVVERHELGYVVDGADPVAVAQAVHAAFEAYPLDHRVPVARTAGIPALSHDWYRDALRASLTPAER